MSKNNIATKEMGQVLGEALQGNTMLKELNVSDPWTDVRGFAQGVSKGLIDNEFISSLNFSGVNRGAEGIEGAKHFAEAMQDMLSLSEVTFGNTHAAITMSTEMTEANFSGKGLGVSDAIMLVGFLPKCQALSFLDLSDNNIGEIVLVNGITLANERIMICENGLVIAQRREMVYWDKDGKNMGETPPPGCGPIGAIGIVNAIAIASGVLSSVNLLRNQILVNQAQDLVEIMESKEALTTLCGLSGEETELDFSTGAKQGVLGAGDTVLIANDIKDRRFLLHVNLADNEFNKGARGMDHVGPAIAASTSITSLNIAGNQLNLNGGFDQVVQVLQGSRVLTSVNVLMNGIGSKDQPSADRRARLIAVCASKGVSLEIESVVLNEANTGEHQDTTSEEATSVVALLRGHQFSFDYAFDSNGVLDRLNSGFYNAVVVTMSSVRSIQVVVDHQVSGLSRYGSQKLGGPTHIVQRFHDGHTRNITKDERYSWVAVELKGCSLVINHYALRHGNDNGHGRLLNWRLEGSNDGKEWNNLRVHEDDQSLPNQGFGVAHWPVEQVTKDYSHFRIIQTGPNSGGGYDNMLCCAGFEMYGKIC
jgi:hypothetical protein